MSLKDDIEKHRQALASAQAEQERSRKDRARYVREEFKRLDPIVRGVLDEVGDGTWGRSFGLFRCYRVGAHLNTIKYSEPHWIELGHGGQFVTPGGWAELWFVNRHPRLDRQRTVGLQFVGGRAMFVYGYSSVFHGGRLCDASREALENAFRPT